MTIGQFAALLASIVVAFVTATWVLATCINSVKTAVTVQISELKMDLAVLKKAEENRDEKINRMWGWWMQALERGWTQHMRDQQERNNG